MTIQNSQLAGNHKSINQIRGGSTTVILKMLAGTLTDPDVMIADAYVAMAYNDHQKQGSLAPLNRAKIKIDQYVELLLTKRGEGKKFIGEKIHDENQEIDNTLVNLQKKSQELEAVYQTFKTLKSEFKNKHRDPDLSNSELTALSENLQKTRQQYTNEMKQFIRQVTQVSKDLEALTNEAQFHTSPEEQRRIEKAAARQETPTEAAPRQI